MSKHAIRLMILFAVLFAARAAHAETITVKNGSDFAIHHFFLSPGDDQHWGPDQLGEHLLAAGANLKLNGVPCGDYDVKLVDEDGDECVVNAPDICGHDEVWTIENEGLLACEGFGGD